MKFVLAYTICSAITGFCNTPVVHPQHFNTWTDCTKHGATVTIGSDSLKMHQIHLGGRTESNNKAKRLLGYKVSVTMKKFAISI